MCWQGASAALSGVKFGFNGSELTPGCSSCSPGSPADGGQWVRDAQHPSADLLCPISGLEQGWAGLR